MPIKYFLSDQIENPQHLQDEKFVEEKIVLEEFFDPMIYNQDEMKKMFEVVSYHANHILLEYAAVNDVDLQKVHVQIREKIKDEYGPVVQLHKIPRLYYFKEFLKGKTGIFNDDAELIMKTYVLSTVLIVDKLRLRLQARLRTEERGLPKKITLRMYDWLKDPDTADQLYRKPNTHNNITRYKYYIYTDKLHSEIMGNNEFKEERLWNL